MATQHPTGKTACLSDLRRRILTLALEPGAHLDETALADRYSISRPPLREVLRQLAGEGYVVLHSNRGAEVAPMTHKTLRNFFSVAPMIYAAVSRLAADHATPAQIMQLKDAQLLFRAAIRDGDTAGRTLTNERFHAIIGDMADNEFLMPSLRRLLIDHSRIGMTFYNPENQRMTDLHGVAADHHDAFIAHIEARDRDAAAGIAMTHWDLSRSEIESFAMPDSIDIPLGHTGTAP